MASKSLPDVTTMERPGATVLRRIAREAGQSLPPATVQSTRRVLINFKVSEGLADAIAEKARDAGMTQKQWLCHALLQLGLPVDPLDLEDRSPRRQRAA